MKLLNHIHIKLTTVCAGAFLVLFPPSLRAENLSLVVSTGSPIFADALLNKTALDFLGRPSTEADFGLEGNKVAFAGRALSLRWENRRSISTGWNHVSAVSAGYFRYSDVRPEGISFFIDPATIKVASVVFEAQTGLEYEARIAAKVKGRVSLSAGVQASYSDIAITSAVLNVRNNLTALNPFAEVKTSVAFATQVPLEAYLSIRAAQRGYRELSIGLSTHF